MLTIQSDYQTCQVFKTWQVFPVYSRFIPGFFFLLIFGLLPFALSAQSFRSCGYQATPHPSEPESLSNGWLQPYEAGRIGGDWSSDEILKVAVVVHVVYNQPDENISDAQIRSQLEALNRDFRRKNADTSATAGAFKSVAADAGIEFYLARFDPDGRPTNGITRTTTRHGAFGNNDIHQSTKGGKDAWDASRYLNVWVCNLAAGTTGYGTPPGTPPFRDGVVVHFRYFGTTGNVQPPYHLGRTATHEVGHWLELQHLWGATGGCTDDDGIADTPMQEHPSSGCQTRRITCGNLNMVQNYMDYSDDACMNLFTQGQVVVMRSALLQHRNGTLDPDAGPIVLGREESALSAGVNVYPNPSADGLFSLQLPKQVKECLAQIFNPTGQLVAEYKQPSTSEIKLDLSSQVPGIYLLLINTDGQRLVRKVIRE
jgi:hypothetical protein